MDERLLNIQNGGAVAALGLYYFMDDMWSLVLRSDYLVYAGGARGIPYVGCSSIDPYHLYSDAYDAAHTSYGIANNLDLGLNQTALLTPPEDNQFWIIWMTTGSPLQFSYVCNLAIALATLCVSSAKLVQFLHHSGFRPHFPQVVLSFCWLGGILAIYYSQLGWFNWRGYAYYGVEVFFRPFLVGVGFTVLLLMGLFLRDISSLTSSSSVPGLTIMKWPAIIIISISWIFICLAGGLYGIVSFNKASLSSTDGVRTAMVAFVVSALGVQLIVCVWGCISILVTSLRSQALERVWKVILCTFLASVFLFGFGTGGIIDSYIQTEPRDNTINEVSYVVLMEFCLGFVPCCCLILVMLNFRVSVQKEIELSKSATSSTSGQSHSSSSSSSSASDPVIEL